MWLLLASRPHGELKKRPLSAEDHPAVSEELTLRPHARGDGAARRAWTDGENIGVLYIVQ